VLPHSPIGLGIGANTAIFTLLDQVLVRPLPVRDPGKLVRLSWEGGERYGVNIGSDTFSYPMYRDFVAGNRVFSGMLCRFSLPLSVGHGGETERLAGELVSASYFDLLGVRPAIGRLFGPEDDRRPGGDALAVLAYDYWVERFQADPGYWATPSPSTAFRSRLSGSARAASPVSRSATPRRSGYP
jgi:hypothetical protein